MNAGIHGRRCWRARGHLQRSGEAQLHHGLLAEQRTRGLDQPRCTAAARVMTATQVAHAHLAAPRRHRRAPPQAACRLSLPIAPAAGARTSDMRQHCNPQHSHVEVDVDANRRFRLASCRKCHSHCARTGSTNSSPEQRARTAVGNGGRERRSQLICTEHVGRDGAPSLNRVPAAHPSRSGAAAGCRIDGERRPETDRATDAAVAVVVRERMSNRTKTHRRRPLGRSALGLQ
jgi:hypothetical protein